MSRKHNTPHKQRKGEGRDLPEIWRGTAQAKEDQEESHLEALSLTAKSMSIEGILDRFQAMRDNTQNFLEEPTAPESDVWEEALADLGAIDAATAILTVLMDEGIWNAEQAKDLIFDYTLANRQLKEMHRKYETPTAAERSVERSGDTLLCPECHARLGFTGKHCGQCGKRIAGR